MIDLDSAIERLSQLDDERLEALGRELDAALADCHTGPIDDDTQNAICIAGAARILLRQRRGTAGRARATAIVRSLTDSTETSE